ncbi:universal stress protein [Thiocapsa rosea]|uniref:Nucleotide-binding universal stress UspA family protein n=1 Tax=Thiocapsa rosea TaxID=69360 RepID=A0A495VDU8_9GAMM|nr:universal stress protein [Thiocapsa rosea]RKT47566.1 nucleotide-binding universal stress UspA family protein [Thiocapsa rosea]
MKRFRNILFVADPEKGCRSAFERAVLLAENNQAEFTLVDVIPRVSAGFRLRGGGTTAEDLQAAATEQRLRRLESLIKPYEPRLDIRVKVLTGTPYLEIIREVLRSTHDLVMRPPEDAGWFGRLLGSDDMNLLRQCPCPVWAIKCKGSGSFRRILAAVDVDDSLRPEETRHAMNLRILEIAGSLALSEFADLHVVHIWDAIGEMLLRGTVVSTPEAEVTAYVDQVRERHAAYLAALLKEVTGILGEDALDFLKPKTHLMRGEARKKIPALARKLGADLVVMGTVGRGGIPGLLMGNTAEAILQQVDCSVLAIKPPGFVTAVELDG